MPTYLVFAAVFLIVLLLAIGWYFSKLVLFIKLDSWQEVLQQEIEQGKLADRFYEEIPKEIVSIPSPYGYMLYGELMPPDSGAYSEQTVILVHGVTSSLTGMIKYAELFRKRGFNVLAYDHRRHGRSGGRNTTYGWYEKYDLKACVDWVLQRFGAHSKVGIFGESMGAATAIQLAAIDERPRFYIADCPYSDFMEQLAYRLKVEYRLPAFPLLPFVSMIVWLRSGFRFEYVSPIRDLKQIRAPILFIHGQQDLYIPKEMTLALHRETPGLKRIYLAPNADHAESYPNNKAEYDQVVGEFLKEVAGPLPH